MESFGIPTQVTFVSTDGEDCCGIAYRDEIICACCGGIHEVSECTDIVSLPWHSLCEHLSKHVIERTENK